jgi:lipoprotein-releasing system permease protein
VNRTTGQTSQSNRTFLITGVFNSHFYDFDSRWIYTDLRTAQHFLRGAKLAETWACTTTSADAANRVARWLERRADDPATLRAMLPVAADGFAPRVQTKTWRHGKDTLLRAVEVQKWMLFFIMALGIVIAGLGIMVTLTVLVAEKSRDIGILASLGTTRGQLMQVFVGTGVLIGLIGSILGLAGGSILLANADGIVRGAAALGYDDLKVYVEGVQHLPSIPVSYSPWTAAVTVVGMLCSAFLFSLIPAWRAARLDPVKAIRRN